MQKNFSAKMVLTPFFQRFKVFQDFDFLLQ